MLKKYYSFCNRLLIIIVLCSCIITEAQVPTKRTDFTITLTDGVILDCSKFEPQTNPPSGGFKCIIICHGFGRSKEDHFHEAEDHARYGYYSMCYSMRGQGGSTGYSNFISRVEMKDLMEVIAYVQKEPNANGNKIAVTGASQGGIIPFMAACYSAPLSCVVPELASPEFASNWIENGCVKMTLLWSLSYDESIVRYNDEVKRYRNWCVSDNPDDWDKLAYELPKDRDYLDKVKNCKVPVLASNSWEDKFFNTLGMIRAADEMKAPYKMYFGSITGHGGTINDAEKSFHRTLVGSWFNYWLNGRSSGLMLDENKFYYASTTFSGASINFVRAQSKSWEPSEVKQTKLYFNSSNQLSTTAENNPNNYVTLFNEYKNGMSLITGVYEKFTGSKFESHFTKNTLSFSSGTLDKETILAGTPQVKLYYSSNARMCQYNFQIWEVGPDGSENFVASINYTDRHNTPNHQKEELIYGTSYSHIFKKGSRIKIVLTNLDTRPNDAFLRTYPFVLPVFENSENKIYTGSSYIVLPIKNN